MTSHDAAVRGHRLFDARRAGRGRPPSADPALPGPLAPRGSRWCTSGRSGRPRGRSAAPAGCLGAIPTQTRANFSDSIESGGGQRWPAHARLLVTPAAGSALARLRRRGRSSSSSSGERLEHASLAGSMLERLLEEPVGEPRIAGQQGPVEVRADRPPDADSPRSRFRRRSRSPATDPAQRLGAVVEARDARRGSRSRPASAATPGSSSHSSRHVADHPPLARNRVQRKQRRRRAARRRSGPR